MDMIIIGMNYLDAQDNEYVELVHRRIAEFIIRHIGQAIRDIIKLFVD